MATPSRPPAAPALPSSLIITAYRVTQAKNKAMLYFTTSSAIILRVEADEHHKTPDFMCGTGIIQRIEESAALFAKSREIITSLHGFSDVIPDSDYGENETDKWVEGLLDRGERLTSWRRECWRLLNLAEAQLVAYDGFLADVESKVTKESFQAWRAMHGAKSVVDWRAALDDGIPAAKEFCDPGLGWRVWDGGKEMLRWSWK